MTDRAVKRKLAFFGIGWAAGLIMCINTGIKTAIIFAAVGLCVSAAAFFRIKKLSYAAKHCILITASIICSALYFHVYENNLYKPIALLEGQKVTINGTITSLKYIRTDTIFITVSGKIFDRPAKVTLFAEDDDYECGEKVSASFEAVVPQNSYDFDSEEYYRASGVFISCKGTAEVQRTGKVNYFVRTVSRIREYTLRNIYAVCPGQTGAFIASMLCSDKSRLTADMNNSIYHAGLGHLFAVSGVHVVMLAAFIESLLDWLIADRRLRSAIVIFVLTGFAVFSGCSPSVVRACIMAGISGTAVFFNRNSDGANSLGAAAVLITLQNPFAVMSVSFLMSFSASIAFGVLTPALCKGRIENRIVRDMISYICVNVVTFPIAVQYFSEVSIVSVVTNLLLANTCSACLTLTFMFMLSGCKVKLLIYGAKILSYFTLRICRFVTASEYSYIGTYNKGLLTAAGIFATAVFVIYALSKTRRSFDIIKCIVFYLVICVFAVISNLKIPDDRIMIYPDEDSYSAYICINGKAVIIDMTGNAEYAYTFAQLTKSFHISDVIIFAHEQGAFSKAVYIDEFGRNISHYSYDDTDKIYMLDEESSISVSCEDDKFTLRCDNNELCFDKENFSLNGQIYKSGNIYDISTFYF